jgi:hypothetical protein
MINIENDMRIRSLLLAIILISLIVLAVYNYNAGRHVNVDSYRSQLKECEKLANTSECNLIVRELNKP